MLLIEQAWGEGATQLDAVGIDFARPDDILTTAWLASDHYCSFPGQVLVKTKTTAAENKLV